MVAYNTENGEYFVDYDKFDMTEEVLNTIGLFRNEQNKNLIDFQVDTPLCSAQRFDEITEKVKDHFSKEENTEKNE